LGAGTDETEEAGEEEEDNDEADGLDVDADKGESVSPSGVRVFSSKGGGDGVAVSACGTPDDTEDDVDDEEGDEMVRAEGMMSETRAFALDWFARAFGAASGAGTDDGD
jgi:hypothetical protein